MTPPPHPSQARAPNSAVVVVGTHLDLIDSKFRTERVATLRAYILALCRSPSGARATGYPDVTWKQLQSVQRAAPHICVVCV